MRVFLGYYRPYQRKFTVVLLCALTAASAALLLPLTARSMTERALNTLSGETAAALGALGLLMLVLLGVQTLASTVVDYHGHVLGAQIEADMRADLFDHYQRLSFSFYDEANTGQLMTRLTTDLLAISELAHHGPEDLIIAALKMSGALIILFLINVPLALVVLAFLPVMAVFALFFHRRMMVAHRVSRERIGAINMQIEDSLAGIRVVQAFTNEAVERAKFAGANNRFVASRLALYRSEATFTAGMLVLTQFISIAVIGAGALAISGGSLSAPDLVAFLLIVAILIDPIQRVVNIARLLQEGATGFQRFQQIMGIKPEIADAPGAHVLANATGLIEFDRVSFRYHPGQEPLLMDLSLAIRPGEYVALIGTSGVGKSTLCALIPRFYEVTSGSVRIDGYDVRNLTLESLRRHIGMVPQDVYLFAGTVLDNLRYGRLDASFEDIEAAARAANAHEFIMELPGGYDATIGQRGVKLSGGQKQRLSIARALLKNPPILIFDEATSALDNESERAIQIVLERLAEERTLIVIAHRLSTIRNARRILVLENGGIVEEGTHDALEAANGVYARLLAMTARV